TRNSPTTYYQTHDGQFAGIEYDMTAAFAESLGVKPRYVVKSTIADILDAVSNGQGDFAAAGILKPAKPNGELSYGPEYQWVQQQIICHRDNYRFPSSINTIDGSNFRVASRASYLFRLKQLKAKYPDLTWQVENDGDTELLLKKVAGQASLCTVADSNIFAVNRRYYPALKLAFPLSEFEPLAWSMRPDRAALKQAMFDWFKQFKAQGKMDELLERYYGYTVVFDYADTIYFERHIQDRLPDFQHWFKQAAKEYDFDWELLAALSYQESHWNPDATSPTGVKGIMMLTLQTADYLGVDNRLEPETSIMGGARYLRQLHDRLPDTIGEPDRTWMALAAYNVGFGHLSDARKLAKTLGNNPDYWSDVEEALELLPQKKYYQTLDYGYARGGQAVVYVNHVRHFRDLLEHDEKQGR
ncbi:MAG: membrane-bound lytic murein transglycosylase MltF, partial [Gammaproteobacteria bacterium]